MLKWTDVLFFTIKDFKITVFFRTFFFLSLGAAEEFFTHFSTSQSHDSKLTPSVIFPPPSCAQYVFFLINI